MRLTADSGLWSTGPLATPTPLVAVVEVSGAVLSWTVDDGSDAQITFTDPARADWLWRVVGESGHSVLASALLARSPEEVGTVELSGVDVRPGALGRLRRLALGHWLRRWWPASQRDAIAMLDGALLEAEIALLTAEAQDFFGDDTFDSDIEQLLAPHSAALNAAAAQGDPRVIDLVDRCREVADDAGVAFGEEFAVRRRDDYALAAGGDRRGHGPGAVANGTASINWAAVPPGIFDAAEETVDWTIEVTGGDVEAVVRAELTGYGSPHGIAVRLRSDGGVGAGVLAADGGASFPLTGADGTPLPETVAWNHDWGTTEVTVGADVPESMQTRERVRAFARSRLGRPADDAFLAEILAAESDY
ncbi:hypothetical protein ABGB19_25960 [Mycobacterium sp. B14F4]|uniref:hypothetical protein n=1 Tax=Mycobacterium sp. B14F4 TaxID=3153565 RepID=UPI00325F6929